MSAERIAVSEAQRGVERGLLSADHHHVRITAGAYRPHHRPGRRQDQPQSLFFGLQPMVSP